MLCSSPSGRCRSRRRTWLDAYRDAASRLLGEALATDFAWQRLAELRRHLRPSPERSRSARARDRLGRRADEEGRSRERPQGTGEGARTGCAAARASNHLCRGSTRWSMLGLGNSVGTPADGIEAELLVVRSFDELRRGRREVKGRIVLFNVPFTTLRRDGPLSAPPVPRGRPRSAPLPRSFAPSGRRDCARRTRAARNYDDARRRSRPPRSRPRTPIACSACRSRQRPSACG